MDESGDLENLAAISLRQTSASQLALQQRARPLDEAQIVQVGELLANMMAGYPHQALEMAAEVYQMAFEDLTKLYGIQQLETALRLFLTMQKFFPHPSEVREVLDEMATKKRQKATAALPKLGCPKCHDGGFTDGYILQVKDGLRQVKECDCLLERRRAKKAMEASS
jgi:hypothetical protein